MQYAFHFLFTENANLTVKWWESMLCQKRQIEFPDAVIELKEFLM